MNLIFSILAWAWKFFFERSNGRSWQHRCMDWRFTFLSPTFLILTPGALMKSGLVTRARGLDKRA
jgi:hypothetical protein